MRNESISAVHSVLYNRPFDSNPTTDFENILVKCSLHFNRDATGIHQCLLSFTVSSIQVCVSVCCALCKFYHAEKFTTITK